MDTPKITSPPTAPTLADRFAGSKWVFAGAALLLLIVMFGRSMMRSFDMDEHQFVAPAVFLTDAGLLPYRDYPYFHMPDLIYIHGAATAWTPHKLLAARTFSVLCGWVTIVILWRAGWSALEGQSSRTRWVLVGGVLAAYLCSQLFAYTNGLAWNHDSAALCAIGACVLQLRGMRTGQVGLIALAGALAGLSMGIRLSFAPVVVPMAVMLWIGRTPLPWRGRAAACALAVAGALLVLAPAFIPWVEDPEAFMFGNLGYAGLSTRSFARIHANYMTVGGKLYYLLRKFFSDPGNAFLFLAGTYGLGYVYWKLRAWRSRFCNELGLLIGLLPMLLLGAFGPSPVQQQYFYMLLPFLTLAVMYGMALECDNPRGLQRWRRLVLWGALLPAVIGFPRWYWAVVYLPSVQDWTPMRVHQTGEWIKAHCPAHALVMTADPLFPLEAGMTAYREFAVGRFAFHVGDLMTAKDRRRFHVPWGEELGRILTERPPDAIFRHTRSPTDDLALYARTHGFRKLDYDFSNHGINESQESFELWVRDPNPAFSKRP